MSYDYTLHYHQHYSQNFLLSQSYNLGIFYKLMDESRIIFRALCHLYFALNMTNNPLHSAMASCNSGNNMLSTQGRSLFRCSLLQRTHCNLGFHIIYIYLYDSHSNFSSNSKDCCKSMSNMSIGAKVLPDQINLS